MKLGISVKNNENINGNNNGLNISLNSLFIFCKERYDKILSRTFRMLSENNHHSPLITKGI